MYFLYTFIRIYLPIYLSSFNIYLVCRSTPFIRMYLTYLPIYLSSFNIYLACRSTPFIRMYLPIYLSIYLVLTSIWFVGVHPGRVPPLQRRHGARRQEGRRRSRQTGQHRVTIKKLDLKWKFLQKGGYWRNLFPLI